jgi:subtilase family serine protease
VAVAAPAATARSHRTRGHLTSLAVKAPDVPADTTGMPPACITPPPAFAYAYYHCSGPAQITDAYGIDALRDRAKLQGYGDGQTIVLVDAYGTPTGKEDLQKFHDTFYPGLPNPNYTAVYPNGKPDFKNVGNGQSGSAGAEGWAGEANLDIEWAYAIAPLAHIVLIGVPPAETEGVQGFPNLFKAMSDAVDKYPPGTVFSQSFGVTEETFGGAATAQVKRFDAVYRKGNAKGDTFLASSGDEGSLGVSKQHRDTVYYSHPTVGWPASSPYVTAVGGTQLQYHWRWNPKDDTAYLPDGSRNPDYFAWTNTSAVAEPVWNEPWASIGTGGGASLIYKQPSWQKSVTVRDAAGNAVDARGLPDVSWNAAVNGGVLVYTSFFPQTDRPGWHVYGGTSAASPQLAGLVALANEKQKRERHDPLGFLNPLLYGVGASPAAAGAFKDIVPEQFGTASSGLLADNWMWDVGADGTVTRDAVRGFPVTSGWDEATGFGAPKAAGFVDALTAARNAG